MYQDNKPPYVIFEGKEYQDSAQSFGPENSKIVQWIIKYSGGVIKDEKQANYVLIGFVVLATILSLFLLFSGDRYVEAPPRV